MEIELAPEEIPEKQPSKIKRIFLLIIGVLLIGLMLSYVFVSFPIGSIIQGRQESTLLENNMLLSEEISLLFINGTADQLEQFYLEEQEVEWSACLQGEKQESWYIISALYQPEMFSQTFNHVTFAPCSEDSIIFLHSHPYKSCLASDTDLATLEKIQEKSPDTVMVIMCEPKRFSVYY